MNLSCSTLVFSADVYPDIRDVLARISAMGFSAIDLAAFQGWQNINPSALVTDGPPWIKMVREVLREIGLRVSSINAGLSWEINDPRPEAFDRYQTEFRALLDLAVKLSCRNLTVQPGRPIEGRDLDEELGLVRERLAVLGAQAAEHRITLSVEGHQGSLLEDPRRALVLMQALWPAVGFTYDPSHWVMQGIALQDTEPLLSYTRHVHVRDAAPGAMQAAMGEGDVDFTWLIAALRCHGYVGAVAVEYFNNFDASFESVLKLRWRLRRLGVEG